MIILAAAIILSLNSSGIIGKANKAKQDSDSANLKEELVVKMAELKIYDTSNLSNEEIKEELDKINSAKVEEISDGAWKITKGNASYAVYSNGEISDIWDGTSEVPDIKENIWNISTCEQFKFFADFVNNGIVLTEEQKNMIKQSGYNESDIVLTAETKINILYNLDFGARVENGVKVKGENWTPIGTDEQYFNGIIEGNNNTIRGIYVNSTQDRIGLFGVSSTIQNLILKDSYITGNSRVGGIVGTVRTGKIINCVNYADVVAVDQRAGGVCGQNEIGSTVENCKNYGTVKTNGNYLGGITGIAFDKVENSYNYGSVSGNDMVGGIAGESQILLKSCGNTGKVQGNHYVGGIVGHLAQNVEMCYNTGEVIGTSNEGEIGGIIGCSIINQEVNVKNCYNTGNVKANVTNMTGVGGIVGWISETGGKGSFTNNYNIGKVTLSNGTVRDMNCIGRLATGSVPKFVMSNNYCIGAPSANTNDIQTTLDTMKTTTFLNNLNTGLSSPAWEFRKGFNNGYPALIGVK